MTWQAIESKLLSAFAYDAERCMLYVRFRDTRDVYRYFEFPPEHYTRLVAAESRGRYFLAHIRNQFRYERMARLRAA
jgi:hypothetical protein